MNCTVYDDSVNYNEPIPYNGVCTAPPVTGNHRGGGLIINIHEEIDPYERRRRGDEEILFL